MFTSGDFDVERFRYWQGQKLRSRDFRDQSRTEAELRWWHNRALHNTFGVRSGMRVLAVDGIEAIVGVKVGCGVAYDCYGREILLQTVRQVPLPTNNRPAARVTLVARYSQSSDKQHPVACSTAIEQPELVWIPLARIDVDDGVPLAQLSYESRAPLDALPKDVVFPPSLARKIHYDTNEKVLVFAGKMTEAERDELLSLSKDSVFQGSIGKLFEDSRHVPFLVQDFSSPISRALERPRVASGATVPGDTPWEPWIESAILFREREIPVPVGMQVTIDTSAAGFTEEPCYFAWLEGTLWNKSNIEFFPIPLSHIDSEAAGGFRFRLWMPNIVMLLGTRLRIANRNFAEEFINFARTQNLSVCWIGIQPMAKVAETCADLENPGCEE